MTIPVVSQVQARMNEITARFEVGGTFAQVLSEAQAAGATAAQPAAAAPAAATATAAPAALPATGAWAG